MAELDAAPGAGAVTHLSSHRWGTEFRALFALGWPLVIAQLAQNALFTTDVIMMGWLGKEYLAAGALANALFICVQLFGIGTVGAVAPLAAQAVGARDLRSVRRTVRAGLWLSAILFIALFPLAWNIAPIYRAIGQDPHLVDLAEVFIHAAIWLLLPAFMLITLRSFLSALGATRVILVITVCGVFVNAICNYALVFGNWGFPRLELVGSGISTVIVNIVMFALTALYIVTHKRFRRYHVFHKLWEPNWPRLWELTKVGVPIGCMLLAEVALFTSASLLQGWLGEAEIAAHSIALTIASLAFMVPLGISQAATVRVGIALGERDKEGVRKAGWAALILTLAFMSASAIVLFTFPHQLVALFLTPSLTENAAPLSLAASFLIVAALFQLFDGTQVTMAANLRGLTDTTWPLIIALIGYWLVGFPIAYLGGFVFGWRGVGIWIGLAAGLAAVGLVLTIRFALRERLGLTDRAPA
ncbi:MAG TPA: MATE family efflux transporter [Devosia sp.]|nr:MATE family efflux transporter [Devosia sp.]